VVAAATARPDQELALISSAGQVIKVPISQISRIGRATQGVAVMKVSGDVTIVSMTVIDPTSDKSGGEEPAPA